LEEAAKAMLIHGTDGLGVAALMRRAGLTHGGFYAHFASREDLVSHAVERMFVRSESFIARRLKGKAPGEGLAEMIEGYLSDRARLSPDFACPIPSISGEARRLPEAARARLSAGVRHVEAIIAESLRAMCRDQAEDLAQSVFAEMVGAMVLARTIDDTQGASATLATARARIRARLGV
jgi:TetR/AcrR family transcriptional repressor of nem operon